MKELLFQSSIEEVLSKRAIPAELLQDLHRIANLSATACTNVANAISAVEGLITSDAVLIVIGESIGKADSSTVESVYRALIGLRPDGVQKLIASVNEWAAGNASRSAVFSKALLEKLARNLAILVVDNHAVWLMQKADQLLRDVGNEIQSVKFVCDLRPVFDRKKENVDAFVLVANLRLVYLSQDGNRQSCEIALTEDELNMLHEKTEEACKKIKVLNDVRSTLTVKPMENGGAA